MRKSGLILLAVLALIFVAIIWAFSDKIVERNLEKIGTKIVGAKVELAGVRIYPFKLKIRWRSLKVTNPEDPFENIIETGTSVFEFSPRPLIKRKFIVNRFEISGLKFHTPRKTSGKIIKTKSRRKSNKGKKGLAGKTKDKFISRINDEKKSIPLFNPERYSFVVNTDELIRKFKPQTGEYVKDAIDNYTSTFNNYSNNLDEVGNDINGLIKKVKDLERRVENTSKASDLQTIKKDINDIQMLIKDVDELETKIKALNNNFDKDYSGMQNQLSEIDLWMKEDYQRIMDNLKLPELSGYAVSKFIFGEKILDSIQKTVETVKKVRSIFFKVKKAAPVKKLPKRMKGQDIIFIKEKELPGFWIKDLSIGGETNRGIKLSGSIENITSQQRLVGQPTIVEVNGEGQSEEALNFSAAFNYLKETPEEDLNFVFDNFAIGSGKRESSNDFGATPISISEGRGYLNAKVAFSGDNFESSIFLRGKGVIFEIASDKRGLNKAASNLLKEMFSDINLVEVSAKINYIDENISLTMNSNIDDIFKKKLKEIFLKKNQDAVNDIKRYISARKAEYKNEYESFLQVNKSEIKNGIDKDRSKLDDLKRRLIAEKDAANKKYRSIRKELEKKASKEYEKKKSEVEKQMKKEKEKIKSSIKSLF